VEELADNFAAALLMPADSVCGSWAEHAHLSLVHGIAAMANEFGVSGPALKWRLLNLGLVARSSLPDDEEIARSPAAPRRRETPPPPFNATFIRVIHRAVEAGVLSVRKAARILGTDSAGLAEICRSYGRPLSYEL